MSTNQQQATSRSVQQQAVVNQLSQRFHLDKETILFLKPEKPLEPWLSAENLTAIARQVGGFKKIEERFDLFIPGLEQIVHQANVVDGDGQEFGRSGVATIGERVDGGGVDQPDAHALAASRSLTAALNSAGFNPLKAAFVGGAEKASDGEPLDLHLARTNTDRAAARLAVDRTNDLKAIHAIAEQKGLIKDGVGGVKDMEDYRLWLFENYGVRTAAHLNPVQRAAARNALKQLPDAPAPEDETSIA